jgi:DNA-binding NarL/FixJ family response regulator
MERKAGMTRPQVHQHGRPATYKKGCRCQTCIDGNRRRIKIRLSQLRGLPAKVDAAPVWEHVDQLLAEGWSNRVIARAADVTETSLRNRLPGMQRERAARLLRVTRETLYGTSAGTDLVPAFGAVRRIRALQAMGWPLSQIGPDQYAAKDVLVREGGTIRASRWREIATAYDRKAMTIGPSPRARSIAKAADWPLPLCWDDDAIDDPNAQPERRRTKADDRADEHAERRQIAAALTARGFTGTQIAMELGVTTRTVERLRSEAKMIGETA